MDNGWKCCSKVKQSYDRSEVRARTKIDFIPERQQTIYSSRGVQVQAILGNVCAGFCKITKASDMHPCNYLVISIV